jgi:hypothetical protein
MKKSIVCIIVLVFILIDSASQEPSREFGKISQEELSMTSFARDPQAEAVVLFDIGESKFVDTDYGYDIQFSRTKRIKVISRAGIKYSEVAIPLYTGPDGRTEVLKTLVAISYNLENGQIKRTDLSPAAVFEERINNRWKQKKFVFPEVKPGTVMEYMYIMTTPYHFNLPDWEFQERIPVVYSRYTVRMIPFYEYAFIVQGTTKFDVQTSTVDKATRSFGAVGEVYGQQVGTGVKFQDMVHVYGMNNVPAFRDESYITSYGDYIIKMDFQLAKFLNPYGPSQEVISTWPKLIEDLIRADEFGKYAKVSEKNGEKMLAGIKFTGEGQRAKARDIINFVKSSFKWDGFSSKYASRSPKEFAAQKTGNSTAEIDAVPVLTSTRENGKISTKYPFLHYFNYVLVKVNTPEGSFFCDGTDIYTRYDRIPSRCINDKGLIVKNDGENWVALNSGVISVDSKNLIYEPDPQSLKAKVTLNLQASEFDAVYYKKNFEDDTLKLKKHLNELGFSAISKINTFNIRESEKPYIITCYGETDIEQIDGKLIISPFMNFYQSENRLTQQNRTYPIDFTYANTESIKCKIKIPAGYKVLTLPEAFSLDTELVGIFTSYKVEGDVIDMDCSYGFKKAIYPPSDYRNIKMYFDIIVKKFHEQIVLERSL